MAKKPKLTQFHYHEALDRTYIIGDAIDRNLLQHPVCKLDKEVCNLIEEAATKIFEAYQLLGHRSIVLFPDDI
jgi:hypothetical protein